MTSLVLVLSNGRVLASRDPRSGWRDSGLGVRGLESGTMELRRIDESSFCLRRLPAANQPTSPVSAHSVGQFTITAEGRLTLRNLPALPPGIESVAAASRSGQRLLVAMIPPASAYFRDYSVLHRAGAGWKPLLSGLTFAKERGNPPGKEEPTLLARFDTSEQFLCVSTTFQLGVNTNHSWLNVYHLTRGGLKRVGSGRTESDEAGVVLQIFPFEGGWFIGTPEITYMVRLSPWPDPRRADLAPYGRGNAIGPAVGKDIALWGDPVGGVRVVRLKDRPVGTAQNTGQSVLTSELYYLPGVGAVWPRWQTEAEEAEGRKVEEGVYVNDRPFPCPGYDSNARLFIVNGPG